MSEPLEAAFRRVAFLRNEGMAGGDGVHVLALAAEVERLWAENDKLREFHESWMERERQTIDFDLHAEATERFQRALDAVWEAETERRGR